MMHVQGLHVYLIHPSLACNVKEEHMASARVACECRPSVFAFRRCLGMKPGTWVIVRFSPAQPASVPKGGNSIAPTYQLWGLRCH